MRRENRKSDKKSLKGIWYLVGTAIGLAIIAFVVTFTMYGEKIEGQIKQAQLDNKKISEIVQESETESASTQMGKTVEESEKEQNSTTSIVTNEANNENTKQDNKSAKTNTTTENKQETSKTDKTNTTANKETDKKSTNVTNNKNQENKDNKTNTNTTSTEKTNTKKELTFTKPVEGDILKSFAKDTLLYSETLGEWATHLGIDIKADKTTIVKASADGKIKSIKNDPRYGLSIIIEHDNGYETLYSNLLSAEFVKVGEEVKQGQSIGTVGNTATFEIADPSHLHFEIIKNGVQQDPSVIMSN